MIGMTRLPMHEAPHRRSGAILENLHTVRRAALSQANIWSSVPSAVACFEDDLEACIAHLQLPVTHRRSTRTTIAFDKTFLAGWNGEPWRRGAEGVGIGPHGRPRGK